VVIAEKLLVSELMLTCGTDPPDPPELPPEGLDEPLLPQAAATRAVAAATATSPALFFETENNETTSFRCGTVRTGARSSPHGGHRRPDVFRCKL
jgi:hypothetical protein